jgi:putative oxidoreductase
MKGSAVETHWRKLTPYLLSTLRIVASFVFMQFGTAKLFAFPGPIMPDGSTVLPISLLGFAAVLEVVGGLLLLVGLFTRPVAFLLSGEMAVAYFTVAAPQGFWPALNEGTPATLFAFVWLYISAAGPGPWSFDARAGREGHQMFSVFAIVAITCTSCAPTQSQARSDQSPQTRGQ